MIELLFKVLILYVFIGLIVAKYILCVKFREHSWKDRTIIVLGWGRIFRVLWHLRGWSDVPPPEKKRK